MSKREPPRNKAKRYVPAAGRWRSAVQRIGRPLALFAIVFQMALLFGHHHFDLLGLHDLGNVAAASAPLQAGQPAAAPDDSRQGQVPVAPVHRPCFLCMAIHAAASLDTGAPQLVLPLAYDGVAVPFSTIAFILPPQRVAAFDSRGPPRA